MALDRIVECPLHIVLVSAKAQNTLAWTLDNNQFITFIWISLKFKTLIIVSHCLICVDDFL